jgi:hypothetical protein
MVKRVSDCCTTAANTAGALLLPLTAHTLHALAINSSNSAANAGCHCGALLRTTVLSATTAVHYDAACTQLSVALVDKVCDALHNVSSPLNNCLLHAASVGHWRVIHTQPFNRGI